MIAAVMTLKIAWFIAQGNNRIVKKVIGEHHTKEIMNLISGMGHLVLKSFLVND